MEKIEDRRIRKTKKQIRIGLSKMMLVKDINAITVKELVEAADINRSTFYLHYRNVEVLLQAVEEQVLEDIRDLFSSEKDFIPIKSSRVIQRLFRYFNDNQDIIRAFLGPHGSEAYVSKVYQTLLEDYRELTKPYSVNAYSDDFELAFSFCFNGLIGIIKDWLNQPLPSRTMDHYAEIASKFILPVLDEFSLRR